MRAARFAFRFLSIAYLSCRGADPPPSPEGPTGSSLKAAVEPVSSLSVEFLNSTAPTDLPATIDMVVRGAATEAAGPAQVRWTSEPAFEGTIAWTGPELLRLTPKALQFETAYKITLQEVTVGGQAYVPERGSWQTAIRTPAFAATAIDLYKLDPREHRVTVALRFSGPVDAASAKKALRVNVDKGKAKILELHEISPTDVGVDISVEPYDQPITLRLPAGVKARDGTRTKTELTKTTSIEVLGELELSDPELRENDDGYFFEMRCSDPQTRNKYGYWNNPDQQCQIEPDVAARFITVSPQTKITIGRGRGVLRVFGDFRFGTHQVNVRSGLYATTQSVLLRALSKSIIVPHRHASVRFSGNGRYLPRGFVARLPISHMNMSQVQVGVRRVQPQNLVFWLSGTSDATDERVADEIASAQIDVKSPMDVKATTALDLTALLGAEPSGVYEITLDPVQSQAAAAGTPDTEYYDDDGYYRRRPLHQATARLVFTDLVLVAKSAGDQLHVWVTDAHTLRAVSGVKVELFTASNHGISSATTNGDGQATLARVIDPTLKKAGFVLLASKGQDQTFLELADLEVPLNDADVSGEPYKKAVAYDSVIYGDRGVYRPGETAHLVAVIRESGSAPKAAVPVNGKVFDAKKRLIQTLRGTTNAAGIVPFDVVLQGFADTGRYELVVEVAQTEVAREAFHVEEFMPERMRVEATPKRAEQLVNDIATIGVKAKYLFGAKAKGEKVELQCTLHPSVFKPRENNEYAYGLYSETPRATVSIGSAAGVLDDEGNAEISCPAYTGEWQGAGDIFAQASVFEAGSGRATVDTAISAAHPAKHYVGLKGPAKASDGADITVSGIIVDWQGKPVKTSEKDVSITLYRIEPQYQWETINGHYSWKVTQRLQHESSNAVRITDGSRFTYAFKATGWGSGFVVDARVGDARSMLKVDSDRPYYWYSGSGDGDTPRPFKPAQLTVTAPEPLRVGKASPVNITVPYAGRMLVTIESDELIDAEWVDVKPGEYRHEIKLDRFMPNVYVSALLLKDPHTESKKAFLPARAFGVRSVTVVPEKHKLDVLVSAPKEIRPNTTLEVTLDVSKDGQAADSTVFATIAAVDEGILQLTHFRTPQLLTSLFKTRALGVHTFETFGWALMLGDSDKSPGGDRGSSNADDRVAPVKPVALWSGVVQVPASGKVTVKLPVPTFRGELRIMAQAMGATRLGSAEARVVVRDPLVLQATLPRFLLNGDKFVAPVSVTNLTGAAADVTVQIEATGGITWQGVTTKKVKLKVDEAAVVAFQGVGSEASGAAHVQVKASTFNTTSFDELDVPLLPNGPVTNDTQVIALKDGDNDLSAALQGWAPTHERTNVWVTSNRYGRELGHLRYLVRYPYGCIEQTTSSLKPLLFVSALVGAIDPALVQDGSVEQKVMYGVRRLLSMQTSSGGFSYWPGASDATYWGTAYATHALLEAKSAGYPVPEDRLSEALRFMENTIANSTEDVDHKYGYTVAQSEPYMLYVLAKAGRANQAKMRVLLEKKAKEWAEIEEENKFLLRAGLYLSGDRRYEADLRRITADTITGKRTNDWSFWSQLRTRGLELSVLEEIFPGAASSEALAESVAARLRGQTSEYYTTQELAWTTSALDKRAGRAATGWKSQGLTAAGKTQTALPKADKDEVWNIAGASGKKPLSLRMADIGQGSLFAFVTVSGIKPNVPHRIGEHGLRIDRRYSYEGTPVGDGVKLGALVEVELTLANTTGRRLENLALVDRVPAGLEIENARLNRAAAVSDDDAWGVDYMNVRDDRIELFGHLEPGQRVTVRYLARAVTSGVFTVPPVTSEAMYEPEVWAAEAGQTFSITHTWKGL